MNDEHDSVTVLESAVIVFDTSALLDVFRYSITSSKRILDYIKKYEKFIWIPYQVKKEAIENIAKVKSEHLNKYKNLSTILQREMNSAKSAFMSKMVNYKQYNFSGIMEFEKTIENKFKEFTQIIENYRSSLKEEEEVYKEFILKDADKFLNSILKSEHVGLPFNIVELMKLYREGELRYKYNIPPGYADQKLKDDKNKFGDLIVWKEILKKASEMEELNLFFVLSDTKEDWFIKNSSTERVRSELIEEFEYYTSGRKNLRVASMSRFIQLLSNKSTDREVLIEIRKEKVINSISNKVFEEIAYENIISLDEDLLSSFFSSQLNLKIDEVSNCIFEKIEIHDISVQKENENYIYNLILAVDTCFDCGSYHKRIFTHGLISCIIHFNLLVVRLNNDEELIFLDKISQMSSDIVECESFDFSNISYNWVGDSDNYENDVEEEIDEDSDHENIDYPYNQCPQCGGEINLLNDAGDGFCIDCTREMI
jgi:hypothetical protein